MLILEGDGERHWTGGQHSTSHTWFFIPPALLYLRAKMGSSQLCVFIKKQKNGQPGPATPILQCNAYGPIIYIMWYQCWQPPLIRHDERDTLSLRCLFRHPESIPSSSLHDRLSPMTPSQRPPRSPFFIVPLCCYKLVVTSSDYRLSRNRTFPRILLYPVSSARPPLPRIRACPMFTYRISCILRMNIYSIC